MNSLQRIYADFQKTDDQGRLVLTTIGTRNDLARKGITLSPELVMEFYTEDESSTIIIVKGKVCYDAEKERWLAEVDWNTVKHENI